MPDKKIKVDRGEYIKPAVPIFTMTEGFWKVEIPRERLDAIKKKLEKARNARKKKKTPEVILTEIIVKALKMDKKVVLDNHQIYVTQQPCLMDVVDEMIEQLCDEMKFDLKDEAQTKIEED
jgi:hypothetical protein